MSGMDIEARGVVLPCSMDGVPFDWSVPAGSCHGLVGESGSGKTTWIRVLLGIVPPRTGEIRLGRFRPPFRDRREQRAFAASVAFIPQDATGSLDPTWPAWRIVTEPLVIHRKVPGRAALREVASSLLREVDLGPEHLNRRPHELSGGQCQRLCIARALALRPGLIFADEPVSALDPVLRAEILSLLTRMREQTGATLVLVSHSLGIVLSVADHVSVLSGGRVVETGPVVEVLSSPSHPATRSLMCAEVALCAQRLGTEPGTGRTDLREPVQKG